MKLNYVTSTVVFLCLSVAITARAQVSWEQTSEMKGLPSVGATQGAHISKVYVLGSRKANYGEQGGEKVVEITDYSAERVYTLYPSEKVYTEKNLYLSPNEFKKMNDNLNHAGSYGAAPKDAHFEIDGHFTGKSSSLDGMQCKEIQWKQKIMSPSEPRTDKEIDSVITVCQPAPSEYLNYKKNLTNFTAKYYENWKASGAPFPIPLNGENGGFDQNSKLAKMQIVPIKRNLPDDVRAWMENGFESKRSMIMTVPMKMTMITSNAKVSKSPFAESYLQVPSDYKKVEKHGMSQAQMSKAMEQYKQMDPEKMKQLMNRMRPPGN